MQGLGVYVWVLGEVDINMDLPDVHFSEAGQGRKELARC